MTGTAATEASEFAEIYGLEVAEIPTHMPMIREDQDDEVYRTAKEKYKAIVGSIADAHERGQPMLVGTVSIEKSEHLSTLLKKEKIPHQVLNARYHEQEAFIVAQAGRFGGVTIATNMAGRGTDIQLGGNPEMRKAQELAGIEDEAERAAGAARIEQEVAAEKEKVIAAGGLYVLGTERHESRRIDNQLRGRSGRQGDPGSSSSICRSKTTSCASSAPNAWTACSASSACRRTRRSSTHGSTRRSRRRSRRSRRATSRRKNLLKFDDVMNDQRKVIYEQRHELIEVKDVSDTVHDMRHQVIEDLVAQCIPEKAYPEQWDVETLARESRRLLALDLPIAAWAKEEGIAETEIRERLITESDRKMAQKVVTYGAELIAWPRRACCSKSSIICGRSTCSIWTICARAFTCAARAARSSERIQEEAFALFEGMRPIAPDRDAGDHALEVRTQPQQVAQRKARRWRSWQRPGPMARARRPAAPGTATAPGSGRSRHPVRRRRLGELGKVGRRGLPLRVGQEVQALPRPAPLSRTGMIG